MPSSPESEANQLEALMRSEAWRMVEESLRALQVECDATLHNPLTPDREMVAASARWKGLQEALTAPNRLIERRENAR